MAFFYKKKAPAGKFTHGQMIFNDFKGFKQLKRILTILKNSFLILHDFYVFCTILRLQFFRNPFFSKKKAPAGKFTHGKIFLGIFLDKKGPCGKMQTRQKICYSCASFCVFLSPGKIFFIFTNFHISQLNI